MALEIPQFQAPDFVTPVMAAMSMAEKRENARTQRMFAENQMRRQSAQEAREQQEFESRRAETERQHKIDQATALGHVNRMMQTNPGAATALANAYGIDVHPLVGAAMPAQVQPTEIDTSTQALPSNAGSNDLSPEGHGAPEEQQTETPDADLEAIMRQASSAPNPASSDAVDRELAGSREQAPSMPIPTSYEAIMNGHHYPLTNKSQSMGMGDKYDQTFSHLIALGIPEDKAGMAVLTQKEKDDAAAATADRLSHGITQRHDLKMVDEEKFKPTAEQQLAEKEKNRQNALAVARIRAASAGAASPEERAALSKLAEMKEQGATDSEVAAAAAPGGLLKGGVNPKVWEPLAATVTREANANLRTSEKRAGLEATDAEGNKIGSGVYKNSQAAAAGNKSEPAFAQLDARLRALIEHVKSTGNRVLSPSEIQMRNSLFSAYTAAARVYNGLGGTDASQRLEHEIAGAAGTPGNGFLMGANPHVLEHLLEEARQQHVARQKIYTRSGDQSLPPAVTHQKPKAKSKLDEIEDWANGLGK